MKNLIFRNLFVFISLIILWMVADYYYVKINRFPKYEHTLPIILLLTCISFFWASKNIFINKGVKEYISTFLISVFTTGIWFFVASFSVLYFHVYIGGRL